MNCVSIGSDNGLSPVRCQAIIWTNAGLLSIEPLQTIFNEILIKIQIVHSWKCVWKYHLLNGSHFVQGGGGGGGWVNHNSSNLNNWQKIADMLSETQAAIEWNLTEQKLPGALYLICQTLHIFNITLTLPRHEPSDIPNFAWWFNDENLNQHD